MSSPDSSALVIGVGNEYRGDDGAGIAAVRGLSGKLPAGIQLIETLGDAASLMDAWRGAGLVIVIDAVQSGSQPGTIHRMDVSFAELPSTSSLSSTHGFGVAEAIEFSRTLHELPGRLVVYGIEGMNFSESQNLTPAVERSVAEVVDRVITELATTA